MHYVTDDFQLPEISVFYPRLVIVVFERSFFKGFFGTYVQCLCNESSTAKQVCVIVKPAIYLQFKYTSISLSLSY